MHPHRPVIINGRTLDEILPPARPAIPPLMRGYLRLGARICGEPAYDADFGVGDFPALLDKRHADTRYLRRLRSVSAAAEAAGRGGYGDERSERARPRLAAAGFLRCGVSASGRLGSLSSVDRGATGHGARQPGTAVRAGAAPGCASGAGKVAGQANLLPHVVVVSRGAGHGVGRADSKSAPGMLVVSDHMSWLDIVDDRRGTSGNPVAGGASRRLSAAPICSLNLIVLD